MRFVAAAFLLFSSFAFAAAPAPKELQDSLRDFVKLYKSAKTHRDLIRKMPTFGHLSEKMHEGILGKEIDKPLPRLDFDYAAGTVAFDGTKVRWLDARAGKMLVDGREFTWNRKDNYYLMLARLAEVVSSRKTSALDELWPSAYAQNRDFFPVTPKEIEDESSAAVNQALLAVDAYGVAGYGAKKIGAGSLSVVKAAPKVAKIATVGYLAYQVTGAVSSLVAGVDGALFSPKCDDQVRELKKIMNDSKISMSGAYCSWFGNRESNMNFFTPDGKELPLIVNWETGVLTVDRKETYSFGWENLAKVYTRDGKTVSEGPKFEEYKKNLEPYRKVLFYIGSNHSCFNCGAYIEGKLRQTKPGPYSVDGSTSPAPAETSQ